MGEKATSNAVGIDLGTTYSAIARINASGDVQVISNSEGSLTTPSVVHIDKEEVMVGADAVQVALIEPTHVAECFKRDMGREAYSKLVNGKEMRPEVLSALILKKLKKDAELKIGPISEAVVTVPAFFDETRRKATKDACLIAGINVAAIINEPSAAALWYGYGMEKHEGKSSIFLVYDLGGGTFDVTLMRVSGDNDFETIATGGNSQCGGKDWNDCLMNHLVDEFKKDTGVDIRDNLVDMQTLSSSVENSKRTLSKKPSVNVPVSGSGKHSKVQVTRDMFEALTADRLMSTQMSTEILLRNAGVSWTEIDEILLVGGSTHLPMVKDMLERISGKTINRKLDVEVAVVQGAAVYAASLKVSKNPSLEFFDHSVSKRLSNLKHSNVNAHSLGVEVESEDGNGRMENNIIIPKNTPIPCKAPAKYETTTATTDGNTHIDINVLEGEATNPEACIKVGKCRIDGIPTGLPAKSPIDVTFSYSKEGRIHVTAHATAVNKKAEAHIYSDKGLSPDEIIVCAEKVSAWQIA